MRLSVIIPAYNEEGNIAQVIEQVEEKVKFPFDLIVVNDHSGDKTAKIASGLADKFKNISLVENKLEQGFANAVMSGLANVKGEAILLMMGDLCDDPDTIPVMLERISAGYDVVCGSRYIRGGGRIGGSKIRAFFSFFVGRTMAMFTGIPTYDVPNAFKMYRRKVLESINIESRSFEMSMEIALKAHFKGFRVTEVPTVWRKREKGKSTFNMLDLTPNYLKWYWWGLKTRLFNLFRSLR